MMVTANGIGVVFCFEKEELVKYNQFTVQYLKFEGINMADTNGFKDAPMECLEIESLAVGGLWGGKLLVCNISAKTYDLVYKHSSTISALRYSHLSALLFSGSVNGELCKWLYRDKKVQYISKSYTYSHIHGI
jgi:hypothetical protein